jgi:hypothetical protein
MQNCGRHRMQPQTVVCTNLTSKLPGFSLMLLFMSEQIYKLDLCFLEINLFYTMILIFCKAIIAILLPYIYLAHYGILYTLQF